MTLNYNQPTGHFMCKNLTYENMKTRKTKEVFFTKIKSRFRFKMFSIESNSSNC